MKKLFGILVCGLLIAALMLNAACAWAEAPGDLSGDIPARADAPDDAVQEIEVNLDDNTDDAESDNGLSVDEADGGAFESDFVPTEQAEIELVDSTLPEEIAEANEAKIGLDVAYHTPEEIQAYVDAHPTCMYDQPVYTTAPTSDPYRPAKLSEFSQKAALAMVNRMRYIAGLSADVTLAWDQEDNMAAIALVNGLNGCLSHYPDRPAALADAAYDDLYAKARAGGSSANLHMGGGGYGSVAYSIVSFMNDSDDSNIDRVGHRRWVLNPSMSKAIFGSWSMGPGCYGYTSMYAHDKTGSGKQSRVAWPAQEMPLWYFNAGMAWSLSLNRQLPADQISVTLTRTSDGKTWRFSQSAADGYFNVENSYYGQPGCVIFRPDGLDKLKENDVFNVAVTDGSIGETVAYNVHFIGVDLSNQQVFEKPSAIAVIESDGNKISWDAVSGAKGYYISRMKEDTGFELIADVSGSQLSYVDKVTSGQSAYTYSVQAHNSFMAGYGGLCKAHAHVPETDPGWPATCTREGLTDGSHCSFCGTMLKAQEIIPKIAHTPAIEPGIAATCMSEGLTEGSYCAVCHETLKEQETIPMLPHTPVIDPAIPATYTSEGLTEGSHCAVCGEILTAQDVVPMLEYPRYALSKSGNNGTLTLNVGDIVRLSPDFATSAGLKVRRYKSSRAKVAGIDGEGLVTARREGKTRITITTNSKKKKATITIKVVDPNKPSSVVINEGKRVTLKVGQTLQLSTTLAPATAQTTFGWKSGKKGVAAVDANGLVTAKKKGTASITVTTGNKKKATIKVKVVK